MPCRNPEYQEFCARIYRYIPCCKKIGSDSFSRVLFSEEDAGELKLIHQFFELRELFLQKKMIKFHAQGICMYPCVRPGDILHIEPKNAQQIKIGDVAVYRRSGRLFGHRTIDKGNNNGLAYIITRPDTARSGNDGARFDQDILGVVSGIERKGKIIDAEKKEYNLLKKINFSVLLRCYYVRQYLFSKLVNGVKYIQQFKAYPKIAKFLFSKSNKKINFSISVPLNIKSAERFNKEISSQELVNLNLGMDKHCISKWTIALNINSRQVAFLLFIFRPPDCPFPGWWLCESRIKMRYRGTVIEEELFKQLDIVLRLSQINRISVSAYGDGYLNNQFLNKNGFKEVAVDKDNVLNNNDNLSVSYRIIERDARES